MPRAFSEDERERIRERLLQAGRDAIPRTGFRKTSVEALTRGAGISKGAFYGFFDNKEQLWMVLLSESEAVLRAELLALVADSGLGPQLRLRAVVERLFGALSDHPILAALADSEELAWLERSLPPGAMEAARVDDDRWFAELWAELVRIGAGDPGVEPGEFAALGPAALALALGWRGLGDPRASATTAWLVDAVVAKLAR